MARRCEAGPCSTVFRVKAGSLAGRGRPFPPSAGAESCVNVPLWYGDRRGLISQLHDFQPSEIYADANEG